MTDKEEPHIKSAYELAMERLDAEQGAQVTLNEEQKKAMAEIDEEIKSGVAQLEIMGREKMAKAQAAGDLAKLHEAEDEMRREIERTKEKGEARKQKIWDQAGA